MKYLISVCILLLSLWCFSQREFAPIGAEWYYTKTISFSPPVFGYMKHKCIKDSIIDGQPVKVLELSYATNKDTILQLGYEYIMQKGDTISYWKGGEFHLLYNFALHKGDSLLLYSEMSNQCDEQTHYGWSIIDSSFTINLNNIELKAYNSSASKGSIWGWGELGLPIYEVIGSLQYLFPQNAFCGVYDGFPNLGILRCYYDDSLGFIQFTPKVSCDSISNYPLGIELFRKQSLFSIYPNPASHLLNIELIGQAQNDKYSIEMYDVWGIKHLSIDLEVQKTAFLITEMPKGNYLVILKNKKHIIDYEKFTKK